MIDTLVIAIDGADFELLKKYGCDEITEMKEFGKINNYDGIYKRKTEELFASFLTGETYEKHGIKDMKKWTDPKIGKILDFFDWDFGKRHVPGYYRFKKILFGIARGFDIKKIGYSKEDLKSETFLDNITNSKSLFFPSYNTTYEFRLGFLGEVVDFMD